MTILTLHNLRELIPPRQLFHILESALLRDYARAREKGETGREVGLGWWGGGGEGRLLLCASLGAGVGFYAVGVEQVGELSEEVGEVLGVG